MHILTTTSASLDDLVEPVDLRQQPADVVALSFTDSDLSALAVAAGGAPGRVVEQARPPVHFSRKGKMEAALRRIGPDACLRLLLLVDDAVLAGRRNAALSAAICERTVLQVAQFGQSRRRAQG